MRALSGSPAFYRFQANGAATLQGKVQHHPGPAARGRHALVVDDNQDAAEGLAALLETFGYTTAVAYDGPAALRAAEEVRPAVALLDIGLPGMDGYELARRLRELPGMERLPLVAVTGYGQDADKQRSKAAGFDVHLVKPVNLKHIHAVVTRLIEPAESVSG